MGMAKSELPSGTSYLNGVSSTELDTISPVEHNSKNGAKKNSRIAIQVEGANKSFGKDRVLNGLNMTVQQGTIYGLLGSSGCGKTTILSAIVGLRKLDEGQISIFGKSPGTQGCGVPGCAVGYMPQEVALNLEFTIEEVCQYFGRLYGMNKVKIQKRFDTLVQLLDLKKYQSQLNTFSDGEKRRASFLVALLHEPPLLILDEPTVGLDPILATIIWKHLRHLTDAFGTTVVMTTHYIEEMRQVERVGIMRGGQLMVEASPRTLLSFHNAKMLEEVVLKYCVQTDEPGSKKTSKLILFEQENNNEPGSSSSTEIVSYLTWLNRTTLTNIPPKNNETSPINRIWALTRKNTTVLLRNVGFVLFLLIVPSCILAIFTVTIGKPPKNLDFGFVSEEASTAYCENAPPLGCHAEYLTCAYLEILRSFDTFNLRQYSNIHAATHGVDSNWGYIHFPVNFSRHIFDRTLGSNLTNATLQGSTISVRLDVSTPSTAQAIEKLIYQAYRIFSHQLLTSCDVDVTGRDLPVEFETPIFGEQDGNFKLFLAPGIAVGILQFYCFIGCSLSYIIEKKDGMLNRSKVTGVTAFEIIVSHAIPQFGIVLVQTIILFIIMFYINIPFSLGALLVTFLLEILTTLTGMAMGFAAAEIFDEEKNAILFGLLSVFSTFLLSGLVYPLESLPGPMRALSYVLPATIPAQSARSVLLRGADLSYFVVYMGFVSQFIFIAFFIILTFVVHKIKT